MKIALTCASTTLGRQLAEALLSGGERHELILIDAEPHRLGVAVRRHAQVRYGAEADPLSLPAALAGAQVLLVPGGPLGGTEPRDVEALVEAARAAGVERIVLLSSIDPRPANPAPWADADRAAEATVQASGLGWTILRLQESQEDLIAAARRQQPGARVFDNRLDGRSAPVALGDVVGAAAAALTDPGCSGRIFELTGPRLVGSGDLAGGLGAQHIAHKDFKYFEQLLGEGLSREQAERAVALGQAVRAGYYCVVTEDVERLTGRRPAGLNDLLNA
jgi:NAD(P)H dehydrogenase (quinone)